MTSITTSSHSPKSSQWYRPTISPEHGVYVMLMVSFLTGAIAAQQWTWVTTLALICGFCGFQAEHPLVWQIKQRKTWKPRLLLWASLYSGIAVAIAIGLLWQSSDKLPLLLIYSGAIASLIFDVVSVIAGIIFHSIGSAISIILGVTGWLSPITASALGVALVKFILIVWPKNWYCTAKIQQVALLETLGSLIFLTLLAVLY